MRVISGKVKGTNLYSLSGNDITRPTLDRIKETLFNIIQGYVLDASVLDLFAGSGALSIEAVSRGAKQAVLCDKSRDAIRIINMNMEKTHLENECTVINCDYKYALENLKGNKFDIIFIDPPYARNLAVDAVKRIVDLELLSEHGIIIIETDNEEREQEQLKNIEINQYDLRSYGRVKLIFLNRKG